ncbi:MAG: DUF167 domain-containing protein [Candidatus Paceibacterota bacterium]
MLVHVRVTTGARKESLVERPKSVHVSVREKPVEGAANDRVTELLAKHYKCAKKQVRLIGGHTRPSKLFEIMSS